MNVAVLGGSHGAFATAADLALAGHRVRLWRRRPEDLGALAKGITLTADQRQGPARLDKTTADLGEAGGSPVSSPRGRSCCSAPPPSAPS